MAYFASKTRYDQMKYKRCGNSGLLLPAVSLGLWHNFGGGADYQVMKDILLRAFDLGITHFDLANNYGPPPGSAESNLKNLLQSDLAQHRDDDRDQRRQQAAPPRERALEPRFAPVGQRQARLHAGVYLDRNDQQPGVTVQYYLLPENGGFDPETGNTNIRQSLQLQIFGETISGKSVATEKVSIAYNFFCLAQDAQ